jgi:hypothetical protein
MRKNVLLFTAAFLFGIGATGLGQSEPTLKKLTAVACYSGALSVFHQDDPNHYRRLEDFRGQHAVHSLAVDQKTHRVYAPEQERTESPSHA